MTLEELGAMYQRCLPEWRRHAELLVDEDEAEDVVQEVMLMLVRTKKYEGMRELRPWIHAALRFGAFHHVRTSQRRRERDKAWEHTKEQLMDPYSSHDQVLDVREALDHNETFHLLFKLLGREQSLDQLATRMKLKRQTLWSRLRRAKPHLRARLLGYAKGDL
jgi:RNA polymerase sigma factor (sigma-70 family)